MSAIEKLEKRLAAVEADLAALKQKVGAEKSAGHNWLDRIYGSFVDDAEYEEAMRLGRNYRSSLKLKATKRKKPKGSHVDS